MSSPLKIKTPNDRYVTIEPLLFGQAAVKITDANIYDDKRTEVIDMAEEDFDMGLCDHEYTYPSMRAAWEAVLDWDGEDDPPDGWLRHKPSNRRRPNGDPAREYVRP